MYWALFYESQNFTLYIYLYMYIYLLFSHQKGDERCMYVAHQRNNISFVIVWESLYILTLSYTSLCAVPSTIVINNINNNIFVRTFVSGVIHHPNYYSPNLLSHVERKCVACKLKAATSWLHKSILTVEYQKMSIPVRSQNKNKAK